MNALVEAFFADRANPAAGSAACELAVLRAALDGVLDGVLLVDAASRRVLSANAAAGELVAAQPASLAGRHVLELCGTPEDRCFRDDAAAWRADAIESDSLVCRADGSVRPVTRRVSRLTTAGGRALYLVVLRDRSEQQVMHTRLAELQATLESTADAILVTDPAGRFRNCNRHFAQLWQLPEALLAGRDEAALAGWMRSRVVDGRAYDLRLQAIRQTPLLHTSDVLALRSGEVIERVTRPQCSRGQAIGRVWSFRDAGERLRAGNRIEHLSHTDPLTGLSNRRQLAERVGFARAMAERDHTPFALLRVNLDRFRQVNETLGHGLGDRVLIEAAERIRGCLRQIDSVARLGGDEFVLLAHQADAAGAEAAARRVMAALAQPFHLDGLNFTVTCSVGITLYPVDGCGLDQLLRHADIAMQQARDAGGNGFRFHPPGGAGDPGGSRWRLRLDHALRQALARGALHLRYQPQVDMESGEVVGAEALIRWTDPERGPVPPAEFIAVAEDSGVIVAIGDWALGQALRQAARWEAHGTPLPVSVNVSAVQFQQAGFVDSVAAALHTARVPPQRLELELTESILLQDGAQALGHLRALARLGVRLAIDDFGTGYSSLADLKRFPIDRLKIDRSLIDGLPDDGGDAAIVRAIVGLAQALQLHTVADGVETPAQRQFLAQLGCDVYQGCLFAPALDADALAARLRQPACLPPDGQNKLHLVR